MAVYTYSFQKEGHGAYLMVIEGTAVVDNETLEKRDAIGVWNTKSFSISVTKGTSLLLIEVPMN